MLLLAATSCLDPYDPPAISNPDNLLVVEGIISNEFSYINLSRTRSFDNDEPLTEQSATVLLESEEGGFSEVMQQTEPGRFVLEASLQTGQRYRVKINTADQLEFASTYETLLQTPEIDSVSWKYTNNGIEVYANTHDPQGNTRYYRWNYQETWEYRANYFSSFVYENDELRLREDPVYTCWQTVNSSRILTASTVRLAEDRVAEEPLVFYPVDEALRFSIRYSILVQQYAISKEAFEFWELLKQNTEELGTFFDPQPSQLPGNLRCISNPEVPVVGFISASSVTEKRMFVDNKELPVKIPSNVLNTCTLDTIPNTPEELNLAFGQMNLAPLLEVLNDFGFIIGYEASTQVCGDCRVRGGTNVMPEFW